MSARLTAMPKAPLPLDGRGRMLFEDDVIALFRGKKSRWWVKHRFAPELKHKLGKTSYWWENEVTPWLDQPEDT